MGGLVLEVLALTSARLPLCRRASAGNCWGPAVLLLPWEEGADGDPPSASSGCQGADTAVVLSGWELGSGSVPRLLCFSPCTAGLGSTGGRGLLLLWLTGAMAMTQEGLATSCTGRDREASAGLGEVAQGSLLEALRKRNGQRLQAGGEG